MWAIYLLSSEKIFTGNDECNSASPYLPGRALKYYARACRKAHGTPRSGAPGILKTWPTKLQNLNECRKHRSSGGTQRPNRIAPKTQLLPGKDGSAGLALLIQSATHPCVNFINQTLSGLICNRLLNKHTTPRAITSLHCGMHLTSPHFGFPALAW